VLLLLYWINSARKYAGIPTPKYRLPFLGHIEVFMGGKANPVNVMWNLYKKYSRGGIMRIEIFGFTNVLVGDFEALKYIFNHPSAQNRILSAEPKNCPIHEKIREDRQEKGELVKGIVMTQGTQWSEQRRFTLRTLRDFGFGKSNMDEMIQDEVRQLIVYLKDLAKDPIDFAGVFNLPVLNALWRVCTGESYEYNDPKLNEIIRQMSEFFKLAADKSILFIVKFPRLFKWFPTLLGRDKHITVQQNVMRMIRETVKEHQETLDMNEPRDFIDAYLIEVANTKNPGSSFYGEEGIRSLTNTMMDLFLAGSETTSTTLTWAILYMAREPGIQKRVQDEIDQVVGRSRLACSADRPLLPYTEAVILEIMRCGNIVPMGVQHTSSEPITVNDITIPPHTMITPLMVSILKGDHWKDGLVFNPERFLTPDGAVNKDEHLIPFSIGKRQCLGETLAKAEMFLFFAGVLQNFSIHPEVEGEPPVEEGQEGVTQLPLPFKVRLQSRQ